MGDIWDYKLKRMQMAWELAMRIIPKEPRAQGAFTEGSFVRQSQKVLQEANDALKAVFNEDEA